MGTVSGMAPPLPAPDAGLNGAVAAELRATQGRRRIATTKLSELADIPYGTLRRYLAGERYIDVAVLAALAAALGTTTSEIVTAAEASRPQQPLNLSPAVAARDAEVAAEQAARNTASHGKDDVG